MRTEQDFLGAVQIPDDALYGINADRASRNFPDATRFFPEWYQALGSVKKACYITYKHYAETVHQKYPGKILPTPLIDPSVIDALIEAANEVEQGNHFDHFIVPAVQGGAGTSINLNVNEIIANRALQLTGNPPGTYKLIDPIEHANIFQSTNDVIPASLRVAIMRLLNDAEASVNSLRSAMEKIESASRDHIRIAYTEMQEAVPSTYGRLFSTYNDALSRDWWRISKCSERIKTVNLGGSAIGSGITVPSQFIRDVARTLHQVTNLPVSRAENLSDATSNQDALVEVHAILKAHAVNLEKIVSDLRLLSSDLFRNREIEIPKLQTGSSIMPGKVNPVIPEFVVSAVHRVYSNDSLVASLSGLGNLELNAYLPSIGHAMIESLKLLIAADHSLEVNMIAGLKLHKSGSFENMLGNPSVTTALVPYIGYNKAALLAREMKNRDINIFEANRQLNIIEQGRLERIITPENLIREGFSLNDMVE
ncbi:MAG TPA: lyase family protein [Bacteroidales bacterium]|nr:lyase family protein [Bacteroidales bacterium]